MKRNVSKRDDSVSVGSRHKSTNQSFGVCKFNLATLKVAITFFSTDQSVDDHIEQVYTDIKFSFSISWSVIHDIRHLDSWHELLTSASATKSCHSSTRATIQNHFIIPTRDVWNRKCHNQVWCSTYCETRHHSKTLLSQPSIQLTCLTSTHTWTLPIQDHCIRTSHSVHHSAKRSAFHFSSKEPTHRATSEAAKGNTWHKIELQRLDLVANNHWEELHTHLSDQWTESGKNKITISLCYFFKFSWLSSSIQDNSSSNSYHHHFCTTSMIYGKN